MKYAAAFYLAVIGVIIYLANTGKLGPVADLIGQVPYGDAVLHAILMGLLALAVNTLLSGLTVNLGRPFLLGSVLVAVFVVVEEATQIFIAHRTFSWIDLGADFIGIWIAGRLWAKRVNRKG